MNLGLVVTTLGRVEPLRRLLDSLDGQLVDGDRVVIVAQGQVDEVRGLVDGHATAPRVTLITSERGLSRGRNAGVASFDGSEPLLCFPNDTTWFPAGSLEAIRTHAEEADVEVGALTVIDEHGPKFTLPSAGVPLDRWNVWHVIETGLLIRRAVFERTGGFDTDLGTGAATPWQAAEGTDFLLRLLDREPGLARRFAWLPADVSVGGVADARGLDRSERRHKLRAYGRGIGRVVTRWRYPAWWRFAFVGGGLLFGLRHRPDYALGDGWWVFLGRLEGCLGRTLGRRIRNAAVSR